MIIWNKSVSRDLICRAIAAPVKTWKYVYWMDENINGEVSVVRERHDGTGYERVAYLFNRNAD